MRVRPRPAAGPGGLVADPVEEADNLDEFRARSFGHSLLQPDGRCVQELVLEAPGKFLNQGALLGLESGKPSKEPP